MLMRFILFLFLFPMLFTACSLPAQTEKEITIYYKFDEFLPLLQKEEADLYVINFWATWCKPCVQELPYFEKINELYKDKKVEVILVSLDAEKQLEKSLKPFLAKNKLHSSVVVLDDPDFNSWIDRVSPEWSGAIPATLFYSKDKREFMEQSFEFDELNQIVKSYLNH